MGSVDFGCILPLVPGWFLVYWLHYEFFVGCIE